ncbi:PadR family transcriptional regulator [uncultured Amnibacterium sp.]|uniref:PadR family transcriptional regulator n=1 Tax=uncultured Amnibacterium sp. TaxID=1631851 RepID=UPI0035CC5E84
MPHRLQEPTYWILTALTGGRLHGYAILTEAATLSGGRVRLKVTTLYAALARLEREGLIAADGEETVGGRRRRHVVLTDAGAAALAAEAARLDADAREATVRLRSHGWGQRPSSSVSA